MNAQPNPYLHPAQAYYGQPGPSSTSPLQFYQAAHTGHDSNFYSQPGLQGNVASGGGAQGHTEGFGGNIQQQGPWWHAFGTGGFEGEPPLLEELGINFSHIRAKSLTVLNPLRTIDEHVMDDADLAGPIIVIFGFATFLLLSGRPQFGAIYGIGLLGSISIYAFLNLMSESGIDAVTVTSVLGYCLLPMVGVSALSVILTLHGTTGYLLSLLSIAWCTYSASSIFVSVLRMSDQRILVAYPIALLYGCFALFSVFEPGNAKRLV